MGLVRLRKAETRDLPEILAIYNEVVKTSPITFDLEEQTVEGRKNWFSGFDEDHPFLVATKDGEVIGYSYLAAFRSKPAYARSVESSIYAHKEYRGQGVATLLMEELIRQAKESGHHVILAGIANDSAPSARLHMKLGFQKVGCFKEVGRKFGEWQDVCFYQLVL
ncbi:MAG TPA: GNAT family N-acetyltransferase [Bacillales bacterium]|nr:GNAT family N-acetyltransferase [Bacillales bacterium]